MDTLNSSTPGTPACVVLCGKASVQLQIVQCENQLSNEFKMAMVKIKYIEISLCLSEAGLVTRVFTQAD